MGMAVSPANLALSNTMRSGCSRRSTRVVELVETPYTIRSHISGVEFTGRMQAGCHSPAVRHAGPSAPTLATNDLSDTHRGTATFALPISSRANLKNRAAARSSSRTTRTAGLTP